MCGVVGCCDGVASDCRDVMQADAGRYSNVVDLYNSVTGAWTTAQLSVGRGTLAAASAGNVAIFAGGWTGSALQLFQPADRGLVAFVFD
jgi:hypothetical protein